MCEQEPETEDGLGKNVKNGVGDDFGIHGPLAGTIRDTPDDWVKSPEDEGEACNGNKERGGLGVLGRNCFAAWDNKYVDDDQVGNASHGIPSPLLTLAVSVGSEETGENHDQVSDNSNKDVGSIDSGEEGEVKKEEWGGQGPIDVSGIEYLAEDMLDGVWNMLVGFLDSSV